MGDSGMICKACEESRANRWCGHFRADCHDCKARALANSPACFEAAQAGAITPSYRDALQAEFGEKWLEGHEKVKEWTQSPNSKS
jgi:hypothetical protein